MTVAIHPKSSDVADFEKITDDSSLDGFDRSDRKYVAVALACHPIPPILNFVDSNWWEFRGPVEDHGRQVEFLCPGQFED